jgi:molybdate transport system permease protein
MEFNYTPFWLSLKLAGGTTLILAVLGLPLVYMVSISRSWYQLLLKAVFNLPLVLPPTVLGYYLLVILQPNGVIGRFSQEYLGMRLAFSFPGLLIGSVIFSLPFMINPILSALEGLPPSLAEASATLGKSRWITFIRVLLPNIRSSVITGLVMSFAHSIGEFGVVLMIGGNIPSETRVASIAIYNEVELLNYERADQYAFILLGFSFILLVILYGYQYRKQTG